MIGDEEHYYHGHHYHRSGAQRPVGELEASTLSFDLEAEIARLKSEETWQRESHNANTLVKEPDLRIVLIALKPGGKLAQHTAAGRLSIQVLDGEILVRLPDRVVDMPPGSLLALDRGVAHDVEAREESSFLLTVVWPNEESGAR